MGKHKVGAVFLAGVLAMGTVMTGCSGKDETEGKTVIEMVQYKPEAVDIFEQFQDEFNATHDDIYLKIDSPNDAMTIRISSELAGILIIPIFWMQTC